MSHLEAQGPCVRKKGGGLTMPYHTHFTELQWLDSQSHFPLLIDVYSEEPGCSLFLIPGRSEPPGTWNVLLVMVGTWLATGWGLDKLKNQMGN